VFILVLSACGEADKADTTVVAALGDSITEGAPRFDRESQYGYWAQRRLKGTSFRNCGVSGERTDQIARRLATCAEGAKTLVVQGGINDLAQGAVPEAVAARLLDMVKRAQGMGLRTLLAEVLPWNGGYPRVTPSIERLNRLIAQIGRQRHIPVLHFYQALEDPKRPGRMPPSLTLDETHPNPPGYRIMGKLLAKALSAAQDSSP
jgi:lysophospholipase L1-like esterase